MTVVHGANRVKHLDTHHADTGRLWGTTFDRRPVAMGVTHSAVGVGGRGRFARAFEPSSDGQPPALIVSGPRTTRSTRTDPRHDGIRAEGRHAAASAGLNDSTPHAALPSNATPTLTRREREIATLISSGSSNRTIADELFIARSTVERHVANILDKLGFSSRTQIATWVVTNGFAST